MKIKILIFVLTSSFVLGSFLIVSQKVNSATGINERINFQGKLLNTDGTNVSDGNYSVTFTLYNADTGGSNLWDETQTVTTTDGVFRVSLGDVDTSIGSVDFNSDTIYLGVKVGTDSEMSPRIRMTAVPYAFNSEKVNGLTVTNESDNPFSTATTLKIGDGKTVQILNGLTFQGTDTTTFTFPNSSGTVVTLDANQVLTNKSVGSTGLTFSGATTDITTGTNENLVITPNGTGNVGISKSTPIALLDVGGNTSISGNLSFSGGSRTIAANNSQYLQLGDNQTGNLLFYSNSNRLDPSGNLTLGGSIYSSSWDGVGAVALSIGSADITSLTVTTDGTGDSEVQLPAQSIGASEILNNTIDFTKMSDSQTLDADTTISFSTFNYNLDLTSTGDFLIKDAGNNFAQFLDDGTITLGKSAAASVINIGIGSGADTINIASNNTVADGVTIGNNNSGTLLSITGGDDWSITTGGAATFASFFGSGLTDCDASTSKLLWNDSTGTFSCGTDLGSNLQVVSFSDSTSEVASFTTATDIWDGTYPNITPGSTNSKILISVNIRGTSDDANDQNPVFTIRRAVGSNPTCSDTQVGGEFVGGFLTANTQDWGASVTTSDAPSSTGNVRYTVCTTTTGLDDANTGVVNVVLTEIGSSSGGGGGGGSMTVRESDTSPSVASVSTLEFGPATTSSDEFIVTDEGSGIARIRIGDQVGILNQSETVTGGWIFNTASTTFTTGILANGGLSTTSNTNLTLATNGTGQVLVNPNAGGKSALVIDKLGNNDIFTASASGATRFTITNSGGIKLGSDEGTAGQCLQSNGPGLASSWEDCVSGSGTGGGAFAIENNGTTHQLNTTTDFLIGGTATSSSKFAIIGVNSSNAPVASLSSTLSSGGNGNGIILDANGSIQTLRNNTLTLGGDSTGDINLAENTFITGNLDIAGTTGLNLSGTGADLVFANGESIDNDTDNTFNLSFGGASGILNLTSATSSTISNSAGPLTLDATTYVRIGTAGTPGAANGADDLYVSGDIEVDGTIYVDGTNSLDTTSGSALNIGTTNATSAVLGSSSLGSFTVTTTSTGDSSVVLPNGSIGAGEILDDSLNFADLNNSLSLDATTTISNGSSDLVFNLDSSGDILIQDAGTDFAQFLDDGTITLGKSTADGTINIGSGTGIDTINIGTGSTGADVITIGNSAGTLALAGSNINLSSSGILTMSEELILSSISGEGISGGGLSDCDGATDKLQWDSSTNQFSCATDSNITAVFDAYDNTGGDNISTGVTVNLDTVRKNSDGSVYSLSGDVLTIDVTGTYTFQFRVSATLTAGTRGAIRAYLEEDSGSGFAEVDGSRAYAYGRITTYPEATAVGFMTMDVTAGDQFRLRALVESGTFSTVVDGSSLVVSKVAGSDFGGGGGGINGVNIRESDGSPTVSEATSIEFGPATTSTDEFIVSDQGSGLARIRLGNQVGMLNEAESVTGGWTFSSSATTFSTGILANGGLDTMSNTDLSLAANGTGNIILSTDGNTGVYIGSESNTPAPLSVSGGIGNNAAFILNQTNIGDLFTASASGATRFTINNNGNIQFKGNTAFTTTITSATDNDVTLTIPDTGTTDIICLQSAANCTSSSGGSNWTLGSGFITPNNSTVDFLLGGQSSSSAKFSVLNMNGALSPIASLSATIASGGSGNGLVFGAGSIQSLRNNMLTLGGNSTGNITLSPNNGTGGVLSLNAPTINTSATSLSLFETTPTIVNAFSAATTLNLGASGGTLTLGNGGASTIRTTSGDLTLNSGSNTLTIDSSDTLITASGLSNITTAGTLTFSGNITSSGTTGLTLSGTGADLIFANGESITNDTNGTLTLHRNDAGTVTLNATDDDSTAALTISSGGAAALTLSTGGAAGINIGTSNANAVTIGNTTTGTGLTFNSGTGGINIGDNAVTKVVEIGGVDNDGADTVRISTNATSADTINIGNANASTTMALTGGDDWSITSGGAATFATFQGAGLGDCDTAATSKLLWDTTTKTFSCGTDQLAPTVVRNTFSGTTGLTTSEQSIVSVSITPSSSSNEIYVVGVLNVDSNSNADRVITQRLRRGASCAAGTQFGVDILNFTTNTTEYGVATGVGVDSPATTSSTTYHLCAVSSGTSVDAIAASIVVMEVNLGADLAEIYNTNDKDLSVGDVVELDPNLYAGIKKSQKAYGKVLGIVSTNPALLIGGGDRQGLNSVPVALSGRVPVKVSTENGEIKPGDNLTSSSIPGVAMKATKAGNIIATAMTGYSGEKVGEVLAFVKSNYYSGSSLVSQLEGLEESGNQLSKDQAIKILSDFKNQTNNSNDYISEVNLDRLTAGLEIVTPKISTNQIDLTRIESIDESDITVNLSKDGKFIIENKDGQDSIVFDSDGNALFKGEVTVNKLKANQIEGLEIYAGKYKSLNDRLDNFADVLSSSDSSIFDSTPTPTPGVDMNQLFKLNNNGTIIIDKEVEIEKDSVFKAIVTFLSNVVFNGSVKFNKTPSYSKDSGGLATIKKDSNRVRITFTREYLNTPVVTANIQISELKDESGNNIDQSGYENHLFENDYKYIITNRSKTGFEILINKPAAEDVIFSWMATDIIDVNKFESNSVVSNKPSEKASSIESTPSNTEQVEEIEVTQDQNIASDEATQTNP